MRKFIPLLGFIFVFSAGVQAQEVEMDSDLMLNIEDINKSLSSNIALQRVDASKSDANDLKGMFEIVEAHFIKKGNAENAVELSTKSKKLTSDILTSIDASNFESASNASTELSRTCKSCHAFYKKE